MESASGLPWCPMHMNISLNELWHPTSGHLTLAVALSNNGGHLTPQTIENTIFGLRQARKANSQPVASGHSQCHGAKPPLSLPYKSWEKPSEPTAGNRSSRTVACPPIIPSKRKHPGGHDTRNASKLFASHQEHPDNQDAIVPTSHRFHTAVLPSPASHPASASQPHSYSASSKDVDDITYLSQVWGAVPWVPTVYSFSGGDSVSELGVMRQITENLVSHNFPLGSIWKSDSEHSRGVQGLMIRCMKRNGVSRMNYDVAVNALDELQFILQKADKIKNNPDINQRATFMEKNSSIHLSPINKPAALDFQARTFGEDPIQLQGLATAAAAVLPTPSRIRQPIAREASVEPTTVVLNYVSNFDAALYSQPGVCLPPGVNVPENKSLHVPKPEYMVHSGPSDPRLYFCHLVDRSEEWYERKQAEIRARGGRKANFGKATQRLSKQLREGFTPKPLDDFIWVHTLLSDTRADRNLLSVMRMVRRLNRHAAASEAEVTHQGEDEKTTMDSRDHLQRAEREKRNLVTTKAIEGCDDEATGTCPFFFDAMDIDAREER